MATTYDKASLVMIPSGVKEDKLYSIKPTNGDGDFTFSRGTDTATRVNSSGLIEKETSNLLLQSNTFDTTWVNSNSTETSGQSGYDGSSDAWLLQSTANGDAYLRQTYSNSGVQTFSFYAKAGNVNFVQVYITGADSSHYFNLSSGTAETPTGGGKITSNITSVGSGWYRCECIHQGSATGASIYIRDAVGGTASIGDNIFIQDAQLNEGLVAQDYLETTTAAVFGGVTDNLPRLDYSGGASCPSLLLEPSRTNLIVQSEYLNTWWGRTATSVTDNADTSPEGVLNAGKIVESATTASHLISRSSIAVSNGGAYTLSAFVKSGGRNTFRLFYDDGVGSGFAFFNVSTGEKGTESGVTADIEDYGNGWYRCYITFTAASTTTYIQVLLAEDDETTNYAGDGTSGIYLYGAQLEAGSYPTSYIPCYGTSQTRADDDCSVTGVSDLIGSTEGTIFLEGAYNRAASGNNVLFELINSPNQLVLYMDSTTNELKLYNSENPTNRLTLSSGDNRGVNNKIALAYKDNDFAIYLNGVAQSVTGTNLVPTGMANIYVGQNRTGGEVGQSIYKQILLFKTRLTNAELAALTA